MDFKHAFHWDIYSDLYDRLTAVTASGDRRLDPCVARLIDEARHKLWQAWDLQSALERSKEGRG